MISLGQERLWFLQRLDPDDPAYRVVVVRRLRGPLDAGALTGAFADVAARHEALRTRFPEADGQPVAVVDPPGRVPVERIDLATPEQAERLCEERANTPFELGAAPPLRISLIRLADGDHVLCVVLHHIIGDGWSLNVLMDDLARCYAARAHGTPAVLPELPVTYADYADAQRAADADVGYWTGKLAGAAPLDLPADRPRPARRGSKGGESHFDLDPALMGGLRRLARAGRCTLFMVLLAAYQALLARHTGQEDILVGTPTAGRTRPELEPMVGLFASTLVLRGDLSGDPPFTELLRRTRRTVLEAMAHGETPIERVLSALDIDRNLSRTPLFQTMFGLHNAAVGYGEAATFAGLDSEPFPHGVPPAMVDLRVDLWPDGDGLHGAFVYSADLFDRVFADRLAARFRTLLASVAGRPEARLSELDVLPAGERELIGTTWNDTALAVPGGTVVDLFLRQAQARPDAVAVECEAKHGGAHDRAHGGERGGERRTYADVAARARAVAAALRACGAGPGSVVAVCLPRTADLPGTLLGVMLAGAAYLPVDPALPAARVAGMVDRAGVRVALAGPSAPLPAHIRTVPLAAPGEPMLGSAPGEAMPDGAPDEAMPDGAPGVTAPDGAPEAGPGPGAPAYVLHTSGSTGVPKGVAVPHSALVNLLAGMAALLRSGPGDAWLGGTSLSFDIAGLELYLPLVTGGRLVLADDATARDGVALAGLVARSGVTHVQATPSGWSMLLAGGLDPAGLVALAGGEALPLALARRLRRRARRLFNMYGPTETTIWSTAWEVPESPDRVSIGRPLANTTVQVLDRWGSPAPVGVPGELVIGGAGVALGYLRGPGEPPEPFEGGRYRTGDRVRWLGDGTLEFLGRDDGQVKVRGHRVEPGEIEATLLRHPRVREAAVVARDDALVAYVAPGAPGDLLERAAEWLPAYMVPSAVVELDALPLTPNGKVDRRALPAPSRPAAGRGGRPATARERQVARIFAEVLGTGDLGTGDLGTGDDFFALGGHSLLATRVIARLAAAGTPAPLRALFANPTVAGFAATLDDQGDAPGRPLLPRPAGTLPPLSPAQERLWFLHRLDPGDASYNMYIVRRLQGPLDEEVLRRALTGLVARHESLRTRFPEVDGRPVAVVERPAPARVERLDARDEGEARALVAARTNAPLDLGAAPPLRVSLIRLGPADHVLCVVLHHIVADGWSITVLLDDLAALYEAALRKGALRAGALRAGALYEGVPYEAAQDTVASGPPELPALAVQHGDVALWQREQDSGEALEYWRAQLAGPPVLDLPTDRPHGAEPSRGGVHLLDVPGDLLAALEATAGRHQVTLFMVLLAAYQLLLSRHTGQDDVLVGSPAAGRIRVELEPLVGYLSTTLVLRGDLSGDPTLEELLARTRGTVLDAMAHQDVPFEQLLAELDVERDITRKPMFQTMFTLNGQTADLAGRDGARDRLGDLRMSFFDDGYRQAKFDLTVEAWRAPGRLRVAFGYDAGLFDAATVAGLAGRFEVLLRGVADAGNRHAPLSRLPVLTAADEALIETASGPPPDWAAAGGDGPDPAALVPELIAQAMAAYPDLVAVSCGRDAVTYAELERRVALLAGKLARKLAGDPTADPVGKPTGDPIGKPTGNSAGATTGATTGETAGEAAGRGAAGVVGLRMAGGSVDAVVAMLAIWRAGAAYLPLDPAYPEERLRAMASVASLVVTDGLVIEDGPARGPHGGPGPEHSDAPAHERPGAPTHEHSGAPAHAQGDGAAYVLYTSGSTGAPKGVVVEHAGLAERVRWMRAVYGLRPGDRVVQLAALSFDTHAEEIYPALAAGATVELLPGGGAALPELLARRPDVTVLDLPTAYFHHLVGMIDEVAWPERLRLVILGGEQVRAGAVERWRERFGDGVRLVNTYGPTETTIIATAAELRGGDPRPPIGRPVRATTVKVLDAYGSPVPPGAPGELHVGGPGVARGYLGGYDPRFAPGPGGRVFRTGDRVRLRRDGQLEFLGRLDDQVKVRGFRIEPGEIEHCLLGHPDVRQAAVLAREGDLVAYVVPSGDSATGPEPAEYVARRLPPHLVPTHYVVLDALPLTRNGKLDRNALPLPGPAEGGDVPPRTDAEELVADVWAEVLGAGKIGAFDDFFALGGHSLLAIRVAARLRALAGVDLPIRTLFDRRTVAALAVAVEEALAAEVAVLSDEQARSLLDREGP
ncbi:amino acid adenylation domain-containing protein [Nonomuraea deserti]|uniref:Amino acid adenylation domain-containing protein n=1 Tax=Nonomuraea deserti TaxID=1848322 RepID=A0A4R4UNQ6_9ACTN|nr:non-ribosomal peptide synthetase [Nonomuraea deserti]TDC90752.1 amino acid adenylation domain-containing protein [Nonomuraea deserti]